MISLGIFAVAMCRIGDAIKRTPNLYADGTFICLNWTLVILSASVQISLIVFYALGLIYKEADTFKHYTNMMMYINIGCTCASQIILSFIFAQMSEPIEVNERIIKETGSKELRIERAEQLVYAWLDTNQGEGQRVGDKQNGPSTDYQKLSGENTTKNMTAINDVESNGTHQTYNEMKTETNIRTSSAVDEE